MADDFDIATPGTLKNLETFRTDHEARITASFRDFDSDFDKFDSECMTKFVEAIHLEKTIGNSTAKAAIIVVSSWKVASK